MTTKILLDDEKGVTVAFETIILFSISIIFLGMIFFTFHDMSQKQNKIMIEEELRKVGNSIANKMTDITIEASSSKSSTAGSRTNIKTEFLLPDKVGDITYSVKFLNDPFSRILLESLGDPFVSVEVPVGRLSNLADNSTIYSMDENHIMIYDSASNAIYFEDGGVIPVSDPYPPTLSIDAPDEGANISGYTYVNTTPYDGTCLSTVEFYLDDAGPKYTAVSPWKWYWNTFAYPDGNHTVKVIAYDCAANMAVKIRNFTIYNPVRYPPIITINTPPDLSNTTFHRPVIKATITDDVSIDFSGFNFTVDGINVLPNATFNNLTPPRITEISYTPSQNLAETWHNVSLKAIDLEGTPDVWANWSFNVTPINDTNPPTARISFPTNSTSLSPGISINISYNASDLPSINNSGLDNMTINVRRADGVLYTKLKQLSTYPSIVYNVPTETWTFNSTYVAGMNYSYNITVFDRSGKSVSPIPFVGPIKVGPGQAGQLVVDTSSYSRNNKKLQNINIKANVSNSVYLTNLNVSWSTSGNTITTVKIVSSNYWTGSRTSGSMLNFSSAYTVPTTFQSMELDFNSNIAAPATFTIVFYLSDSTTKTVIFPIT